jgi:hypothetical protein
MKRQLHPNPAPGMACPHLGGHGRPGVPPTVRRLRSQDKQLVGMAVRPATELTAVVGQHHLDPGAMRLERRQEVRPAFARRLGGAALEAIPLALWVSVGRLRLVQQLAQVVEVRLRGSPLLEVGRLPFRDELIRGHEGVPNVSNSHRRNATSAVGALRAEAEKAVQALPHLGSARSATSSRTSTPPRCSQRWSARAGVGPAAGTRDAAD